MTTDLSALGRPLPAGPRLCFGQLGHVQRLLAQRRQDHQTEGEAEPAAVDAVNQHSVVHEHTKAFQPAGEFLVGHALRFAQVFDERLGPSLVKVTRLHLRQSCIVFDALILKEF